MARIGKFQKQQTLTEQNQLTIAYCQFGCVKKDYRFTLEKKADMFFIDRSDKFQFRQDPSVTDQQFGPGLKYHRTFIVENHNSCAQTRYAIKALILMVEPAIEETYNDPLVASDPNQNQNDRPLSSGDMQVDDMVDQIQNMYGKAVSGEQQEFYSDTRFASTNERLGSMYSNTSVGIDDDKPVPIAEKYQYIDRLPFKWSTFQQDFPYSILVHRRKKDRPRIKPYQLEFRTSYDQFFWSFDDTLIKFIQFFHPRLQGLRKIIGFLFYLSGLLSTELFQLEIWMCITLSLTFYQYDTPARIFNWMIILDILVVRTFKRFAYRRRPSNMLPPRALYMKNLDESSFPSMTVVTGATMIYAVFISVHKMSILEEDRDDMPMYVAVIMSFFFYLMVSFFRVHQGANYPSDCLMTLPIIILILLLHWAVLEIGELITFCPSCNNTYCYYEPNNPRSVCTSPVTRNALDIWTLNPLTNALAVIVGYICLSFFTYPIDFWCKLTYFLPSFLAVWVFQNMLLCPNKGTNYQGVYSPETGDYLKVQQQAWSTVSFFLFAAGLSYVLTQLLGKRTGNFLSWLLSSIFFFVIFFWTLHALVTVRLTIQDTIINENIDPINI